MVSSLRSHYSLQELLSALKLPRSTYYDRLKRDKKPDKYAKVKAFIKKLYYKEHETYGYRRIHDEAVKQGFLYAEETIRRLMSDMGLKVSIYSKHTAQYHSYKGKVGIVAPNILKQQFKAKKPLTTMHTDVTQVRLYNGEWGYVSAITDEASREVLVAIVSSSPNKALIQASLDELKKHLKAGLRPILHSDQGWQYQMSAYRARLKQLHIRQSMSRKGNCHDNAPIESFFNLMKRECLNRYQIDDINALRQLVNNYVQWFNNERISRNKNGLTPVEYRNQAMVA
ncbi:transposase IS150 IS3 family protein [Agrilactobacillus composti DSM 18527 = JCM 14202]|uniref:Transposase IS150 IS3 family protein n=1 Tax=Agrilactobacillus composti DSM 18527 = JCM 14202 TaxID=1423734 RepID=X0QTY8_9LACO|nr:IS3 family transposase [Agrilactobacillus composti]KRM34286.1 transposase IS150 IS3 family protein [Agrilactobacillus composti DSM 18527 = JCM 14202]GAF42060.1 mobile element protein [Agrilactobacillus composti DSM 18527 = JCM 14202]